jgi:hypothetical protein
MTTVHGQVSAWHTHEGGIKRHVLVPDDWPLGTTITLTIDDEDTVERDAWKKAALLYRRLAADGVLRLAQGHSYAQAQDLYDEALAAEPGADTSDEPTDA